MVFNHLFNNATLGIIGFTLSAYSVYVEHKVELHNDDPEGEEFHALCDIEVRCIIFMNYKLSSLHIRSSLIQSSFLRFSFLRGVGDWRQLQVRVVSIFHSQWHKASRWHKASHYRRVANGEPPQCRLFC